MKSNKASDRAKDYIVESCIILMERKSFSSITISEIATKAGVNRSTYYRNFKSKESIIQYFLKRITRETLDEIIEKKVQKFTEYLIIAFNRFLKYKKELMLIHKNKLFHLYVDATIELIKEFTQWQQMSTSEIYATCFFQGGAQCVFDYWIANGMQETPEEMAEIALTFKDDNLCGSDITWQLLITEPPLNQ